MLLIKSGYLKDVLHYTSQAKEIMNNTVGISDFYYALKRFDSETFIHSEDVARLAVILAKRRDFSEERLVNIAIAGYLHDVGKIFTGIKIISKTSRLSKEEYSIIKEHPIIGYRHLKEFITNEEILLGILQHHERLDGSGYNSQIKEEQISEFGKIIAIADVFCAMTAVRPYKNALSCEETLQYMVESKGFDSSVLKLLIEMYRAGKVGDCA